MPDLINKLTIGHLLLSYRTVSNYKILIVKKLSTVFLIPQWSCSRPYICCWWCWISASPLCAGGGIAWPDCGAGVVLGAGQPGGGRPHVPPLVQALLQRLPASTQGHHSVPPLEAANTQSPPFWISEVQTERFLNCRFDADSVCASCEFTVSQIQINLWSWIQVKDRRIWFGDPEPGR